MERKQSMTPAEMQQIKERHTKKKQSVYCAFCYDDFPCDVVKLLESVEKPNKP
jgi:hypothetical protein